jgi:hypothetical protein
MSEEEGGAPPRDEPTGREREVLRARRESRERLGDRAFALNLERGLGVREPGMAAEIRSAFEESVAAGEVGDEVRTLAGRVVLRRDMG